MWIAGLTPVQRDALRTAEGHWSRYSGIATVPATTPGDAQVSITEVSTLGAVPSLGANMVEYAVTNSHVSNGYYVHADMQVAGLEFLTYGQWLDTFLHELGHVAGLAHVASPAEIMRPAQSTPLMAYSPGDIAGLETERPV